MKDSAMVRAGRTVDAETWAAEITAALPDPSLRRIALATLLTIVVGFGGFIGWAGTATLQSAVPANGVIVAAGKRKTVMLAEPGLLKELLAHEGDHVVAGQMLLRMDDVQARTAVAQAHAAYWGARARLGRLEAEALDRRALVVPDDLSAAADDPVVAAAVAAEAHQFHARWEAFDATIRVAGARMAQQEAQLAGLRAQLPTMVRRLDLVHEEQGGVEYLLARGLATKQRALELRRNDAEMRGMISEAAGRLIEVEQTIAQTRQEMAGQAETRHADISRDRADTLATLADATQRMRAARDLLEKREVLAPEAGTVTDVHFFTPGSSITPGQAVLDIVPNDSHMLVEGNVSPIDIEHVAAGQRVNVKLTSYKSHRVPTLSGRLVYVGADRQTDANSQPVFLVRAELDADALRNLPGVVLYPGMPADVLVINGERTVLDFLLSPMRDSLRHAMNEE